MTKVEKKFLPLKEKAHKTFTPIVGEEKAKEIALLFYNRAVELEKERTKKK